MNGITHAVETAPSIVLVIAVGVLFAAGIYLLLERTLTRVLLGFILIGNGANLLFLVAGGRAGRAPIVTDTPGRQMSDPLVQAMVLTAIVITLGLTAFILAMAYRSWQLNGHDEVQDDAEDARVAKHAAHNAPAYDDPDTEGSQTLDEEAAETHDDTAAPDETARAPKTVPAAHAVERGKPDGGRPDDGAEARR